MKCRVFVGTPRPVGGDVNRWLEEIEKTSILEIVSVTQSFHNENMILTIIYKDFEKIFPDFSGKDAA